LAQVVRVVVTELMAPLAAKVRCKEARRILRKPVGVPVARQVAVPVALLSSVLAVRVAREHHKRLVPVLAAAVLAGTVALVVRALPPLLAQMLRPVLAAAAAAGMVMPQPLVAVAVVVSASLVKAQRVLAVPVLVVAVLAVLAARTVLHQPQMLDKRAVLMVAVVVALTMTGRQVALVLSAQFASSTPVWGAHSHRPIQETYKWNTLISNFTSKSVTGNRMSTRSLRATSVRRSLTWTQKTYRTRLLSSSASMPLCLTLMRCTRAWPISGSMAS
jgi:hypothetical protein